MSIAYSGTPATEIPQLTELQKGFDAQLTAASMLKDAIAKVAEVASAARAEKMTALLKQMLPAPPAPPPAPAAIAELAKAACRDIKAADDKATESKDALNCVLDVLNEQIKQFEKQHCSDAIQVYTKNLAEILLGEAQKRETEEKIKELRKACTPLETTGA